MENQAELLMAELHEIKRMLAEHRQAEEMRTYTAGDLARSRGCSVGTLHNKPWTLPNFGRPDIGERPGRWLFKTVVEWMSIPEDERKARWEAMGSAERRKAMGRN